MAVRSVRIRNSFGAVVCRIGHPVAHTERHPAAERIVVEEGEFAWAQIDCLVAHLGAFGAAFERTRPGTCPDRHYLLFVIIC